MEVCEHGERAHILVHESGHALAAIDHGIEFKAIEIYAEDARPWVERSHGYAAGGVVPLSDDPVDWVGGNPLGSLLFAMAGSVAERAILGHEVPFGFVEDLKLWRTGAGLEDADNLAAIDAVTGKPFLEVKRDAERWAEQRHGPIISLADYLASSDVPFTMPYGEVLEFLNQHY